MIATLTSGKISAVDLLPFAPVAPAPIPLPNETKAEKAPFTALPNRIRRDDMNKPLTSLRGRAFQYARESVEQAEEGRRRHRYW